MVAGVSFAAEDGAYQCQDKRIGVEEGSIMKRRAIAESPFPRWLEPLQQKMEFVSNDKQKGMELTRI